MESSISEDNGLEALGEGDLRVYSVGISTAGLAEMRMARNHSDRQIIATTIDLGGAEYVQKRVGAAGLSGQIAVKIEDVRGPLPYEDGYFDYIYARLVLHYLPRPDLRHALNELHRVLKANGKLFVVVRSSASFSKSVTYDSTTELTSYISDNGEAYKRLFHTEESIQKYLKSAGFAIQYIKSYEEHLCEDFYRKQPSKSLHMVIETLASK